MININNLDYKKFIIACIVNSRSHLNNIHELADLFGVREEWEQLRNSEPINDDKAYDKQNEKMNRFFDILVYDAYEEALEKVEAAEI